MNKITISAGILVILGVVALFWFGAQSAPPSQQGPATSALAAAQASYDFGTISMANGNVEKLFKVTNSTDGDIILKSLTTSCMCTTAYIEQDGARKGPFGMPGHGRPVPAANEVIPAGGTINIVAVFDPAAHGPAGVGRIDRFIYLRENSGAVLELEMKANVTP